MKSNEIYVAGVFDIESEKILTELKDSLFECGVSLKTHNRNGEIYQSVEELMDLYVIQFAYELFQTFILNGSYDLFKYYILQLFDIIQQKKIDRHQTTLEIDGIPTVNGSETIKCKVSGHLSKKQKEKFIDRSFELANQVVKSQVPLLEKNQFLNALNGHVFKYNVDSEELNEVDITEVIKKIKKS